MSSSKHIGYREKDISILGTCLTQGLDDTWLTVEAQYSINFSRSIENFASAFIIMEANFFLGIIKHCTHPHSP